MPQPARYQERRVIGLVRLRQGTGDWRHGWTKLKADTSYVSRQDQLPRLFLFSHMESGRKTGSCGRGRAHEGGNMV